MVLECNCCNIFSDALGLQLNAVNYASAHLFKWAKVFLILIVAPIFYRSWEITQSWAKVAQDSFQRKFGIILNCF